ncbi:glycosyltransferase family 4 protein [Cohnella rhizosphaerae]|uniref:glycosyltransferase family 4 protein n=1 Tax=Cohnella rhizosphaerae TaxID=1457232 RepID=UPI002405B7F6|nr:glycosyltransferase family 4 protein [Cohnella rhizosphaerae]
MNKIERLRSYASKVKHERSLSSIRLEQQSIRAKFLALPNVTFDYSTLYLLPWLDIGGVEQVFLHLLSNVNREIVGNRYLMTTIKHEHPWDEQFAKHCEGIFHLPLFCRGDAQMLQFICDFIENNQVRIIHISNSRLGYRSAAYLKERFPYLKIIDTLHMEEPYKPWDYFRVSRDFGKILDHRVVLTNYQKQRLINIYEEKESRVSVIANGIELFDKSWPESKKELAFIGRLVDQKRPVFFVQIADFLVKAKIRYPIVIIGSGPLENKLKKQLKKKGLQNKIVYKPAMSNIRGYLRESVHVLVAPSKMEGLPMTGLESMAEGTLVIASNVPGWTDLIDKNINGILLDNEEGAAQWAEQIMKALSDDAVIEELKYNARLKVEIEYSIGQMCFNYEQIYIRGGKNGKH